MPFFNNKCVICRDRKRHDRTHGIHKQKEDTTSHDLAVFITTISQTIFAQVPY